VIVMYRRQGCAANAWHQEGFSTDSTRSFHTTPKTPCPPLLRRRIRAGVRFRKGGPAPGGSLRGRPKQRRGPGARMDTCGCGWARSWKEVCISAAHFEKVPNSRPFPWYCRIAGIGEPLPPASDESQQAFACLSSFLPLRSTRPFRTVPFASPMTAVRLAGMRLQASSGYKRIDHGCHHPLWRSLYLRVGDAAVSLRRVKR